MKNSCTNSYEHAVGVPSSLPSKEESFFVFTKKHDNWYIGDLHGNQKNICSTLHHSSVIMNNNSIAKEKKKKQNNSPAAVSRSSTSSSSIFTVYQYPIFKEIAEKYCKDDNFWYNLFIKMSKNIFNQNIKFLVPINNNEILGKIILKGNASSFIIIKKEDDTETVYKNVKDFLKKKNLIISDKENFDISKFNFEAVSVATAVAKKNNINNSSNNNTNLNLTKKFVLINNFINEAKKGYDKKNFKKFLLLFNLYIRSIFFQNNNNNNIEISNEEIKNVKNIFWNNSKQDFEGIFLNNDFVIDNSTSSSSTDNNVKKIDKLESLYLSIIEKNIYKNNCFKNLCSIDFTGETSSMLKIIISNDFFKVFLNFFDYFMGSYSENTVKISNKFIFKEKDECSSFSSIYKKKIIYPSIIFGLFIVDYIVNKEENNFLQILKLNFHKMKNYRYINNFELKNSINDVGSSSSSSFLKTDKYYVKKLDPKLFESVKTQKEKENYIKLYKICYKMFQTKLLKKYAGE